MGRSKPTMLGFASKILKNLFHSENEENLSGADILAKMEKQYQSNRLMTTVSVVGLLLFITVAALFPFKDRLFSIIYQKPSTNANVATNLVTNGNFEAGNLNPWQISGQVSIVGAPVYGGQFAASATGGSISQKIPVIPGKTYTATAWVYPKNISSDSLGGSLYVMDASGSHAAIVTAANWTQMGSGQNTWVKISFDFESPSASITLVANSRNRKTNLIFDDIQLFEKPK